MGFQDEDGTLNWDISKQSLLKQYSRKQSSSSECRSILMLPAFMFAMYEKDGLPLEKILLNVIHVKLRYPAIRRYEIENLYEIQETVTTEKRKRGGSGHAEKKKRK